MGEFVPSHSYAKGPVFVALDDMSVRPDAGTLLSQLATAISGTATSYSNLDDIFAQHLFTPMGMTEALRPDSLAYLKRTWYDANSKDNFFHAYQPIGPIIGQGFLKTIEISLKGGGTPLPIDSWWLMDHTDFEVINLVSARQVTMLVCTPRPSGAVPTAIMSSTAEAYTTGRLGVETRRFPD